MFQQNAASYIKKQLFLRGLPQEVFFHVPNEGNRKPQYAHKLKLQGVLSGVADIVILLPAQGFHGLLIELKKAGGSPSAEQKTFLHVATDNGYLAVVVNDMETLQETIDSYLNDHPITRQ